MYYMSYVLCGVCTACNTEYIEDVFHAVRSEKNMYYMSKDYVGDALHVARSIYDMYFTPYQVHRTCTACHKDYIGHVFHAIRSIWNRYYISDIYIVYWN